ncbi:MAG TPA: methyltransferase domain-containing protein [Candidatus Thermoplasmatota archaeon]|nr:methyltransferase domain-containing protein [Candidatus Thermoplasmatota archaeon]
MDDASRLADAAYVRFQYADDEKLRVRIETHERYSENTMPFVEWVLGHVDARPGQRLLDVGSGPGQYHSRLGDVRVVAMDLSAGMLAKVRVPAVRADAQALPFAEGSFDRVMANHVLYHVPDQRRALAEIRRVVRSGGRVVLATNGRTTMRELFGIADEAAQRVGVAGYRTVALRFGLEDVDRVREVEPVLAYVASMWVDQLDAARRAEFLERVDEQVRAIIAREGVFRVPKHSGCIVADS